MSFERLRAALAPRAPGGAPVEGLASVGPPPAAFRLTHRVAYVPYPYPYLDVHCFALGGETLRGATARIVWELLGVWRAL